MSTFRSSVLGAVSAIALVASANAADIYRAEGPGGYKDGPAYVPVATWTGFYVGVNGGYGWTSNDSSSLSPSGGFGGGQIGYNWQAGSHFGLPGSLVLGIEADIQGADISDSASAFGLTGESRVNYFGTVRGRLGLAFDRALVYATGGFAYGEVENSISAVGVGGIKVRDTQTGYTVGGGIEYKINPSWSVKGEYQFISLDASDSPVNLGFDNNDRSEFHTIRAGLNYHVGSTYEPLK
jgi:outer membrane immunogenic protein